MPPSLAVSPATGSPRSAAWRCSASSSAARMPRRRCVGETATSLTPAIGTAPPGRATPRLWAVPVPTMRPSSSTTRVRSSSTTASQAARWWGAMVGPWPNPSASRSATAVASAGSAGRTLQVTVGVGGGRGGSGAGALAQQGGHGLAVGLATGGLHDLADEEAGELAAGLVVPADEALPLGGVRLDHLVDGRGEGVGRHGLEALRLRDGGRVVAGLDYLGEDGLGLRRGELPADLHLHQRGQLGRVERRRPLRRQVVLDVGEHAARVGPGL